MRRWRHEGRFWQLYNPVQPSHTHSLYSTRQVRKTDQVRSLLALTDDSSQQRAGGCTFVSIIVHLLWNKAWWTLDVLWSLEINRRKTTSLPLNNVIQNVIHLRSLKVTKVKLGGKCTKKYLFELKLSEHFSLRITTKQNKLVSWNIIKKWFAGK